ncbi:hypothetical protein F4810DRAFT_694071 [Camillea tinctor]|nr:hypothetical protein F4810DRAFT_694071 [Camillea tinctor]
MATFTVIVAVLLVLSMIFGSCRLSIALACILVYCCSTSNFFVKKHLIDQINQIDETDETDETDQIDYLPERLTPSSESLPIPDLVKLGISRKSWNNLEKKRRTTTPRFLFRGFNQLSGGALDPRLNSTTGIVPHGFLHYPVKPWPPYLPPGSMFDMDSLGAMIDGHLMGFPIPSPFSSWAVNVTLALQYANRTNPIFDSHLAVVDTALLPPYALVYHTPDLAHAGISNIAFTEEYFIYGPICGPAFSCVSVSEMESVGLWCQINQQGLNRAAQRVEFARRIALLFKWKPTDRPDAVIAITAIVASMSTNRSNTIERQLRTEILKQLDQEVYRMKLPERQAIGLVNPKTYVGRAPEIKWMVSLLMHLEKDIRKKRRFSSF